MANIIAPTTAQASTGLVYVQKDAEYIHVRRRGRFTIEKEVALNADALWKAVEQAQEQMVEGLRRAQGLEWVSGSDFDLLGPMPTMSFDDDPTPDHGPLALPREASVDGLLRWSNDQAKKRAKDLNKPTEYVDFMLVGTFARRYAPGFRVHIPESR